MSSFFIYHTHDNFNIADPAVRRTHVIHKPCTWPSSPQVLCSSVVRASDHCMEDHRFNSCWGLRFFLCPMLVICWSHFSFLYQGLNLTIFVLLRKQCFTNLSFNFSFANNLKSIFFICFPTKEWQQHCKSTKKLKSRQKAILTCC